MPTRKRILLSLALLLFTACTPAQATPTPTPQPSATTRPTATQTPLPTVIPTVTPILPSVDHDLSLVNAAEIVLEGEVWVVKNGAGEVTARWDESAQAWAYEGEAIQMRIALVGFPNENIQLPEEMTQFMPDDPLKHLNNNGAPIPDGTIVDWDIRRGGGEGGYVQSTAYTAVRVRGMLDIDKQAGDEFHRYLMLFEIRLTPDQSIMLAKPVIVSDTNIRSTSLRILPGGDISLLDLDPFSETFNAVDALLSSELIAYIDAMVGNQILLGIRYNYPESNIRSDLNDQVSSLLAFIRAGEMPSQSLLDGLDWSHFYGDDLVVSD